MASEQNWSPVQVLDLFELPFLELVHRAQSVYRRHFDGNRIQLSSLLSIKTGGCPEDCAYCPQSAHYETGVEAEKLMDVDAVMAEAGAAKAAGAGRFCMGAAWRELKDRDLEKICRLVAEVKSLGLETCATLGMLTRQQAQRLKEAGLDFYNHNLDTSEAYYKKIVSTRRYQERLETLGHVRSAGMKLCCGGIIGMGEAKEDRAELLRTLASLPEPPQSVPINWLVPVPGTPLAECPPPDPFDFVRTIAVARILMPSSYVRLSAGRAQMSDELQALCFLAGANSIFFGDSLLTADNADMDADRSLLRRLDLEPEQADVEAAARDLV